MTPTLLTLYGADQSVTDAQIANALVSLARVSPAERSALYRKYPELMGVAPWISKVLSVAKKVGTKGKKLVSKVKGLVSKARARSAKKRSAAAPTVARVPAARVAPQSVVARVAPASMPRNVLPLAIAAGAVLVVVLASRRRG